MSQSLNIYGRQPVFEALRSKQKLEEIWLDQQARGKTIHAIIKLATKKSITIKYCAAQLFTRVLLQK